MNTWQRQWARVNRWYDRFGKIDAGVEHYQPSDFSDDEMWSFFINCYHFKDWLKNDPASGLSNQEVEDFVDKSANLRLCGDLANGSKHAVLTRARVDKSTRLKSRKFKFDMHAGQGEHNPFPTLAVKYVIEANGVTYDTFGLATDCLKEWQSFLKANGLPTTF